MRPQNVSAYAFMALIATANVWADDPKSFDDGFENGLRGWGQTQKSIEFIQEGCSEGKQCLRISRENSRGYTYVARKFGVPAKGTLVFEGYVRADDVVPGEKNYQRGKFVAVVFEGNKETDWPNADFEGTIGQWTKRTVTVPDVDPTVAVELRIGLQNPKGTICVDDVKVRFIPAK